MSNSKMELNIFQQWFLLTFALLGTLVLIDSFTLGTINRTVIYKDLSIGALTSVFFVAFWNWLHLRRRGANS